MTAAGGDDRDWRATFFGDFVTDPKVRARVSFHIATLREADDPEVTPSDVQAARNYIQKCVNNMPVSELSAKSVDDLASLWARGALGAAKYRTEGPRPARKSRKRSRREGNDD